MISNCGTNIEGDKSSPWAVIFDVDGTMVDNMDYHENAWIELGRRHNLAIDHEFYIEKIHSRNNDDTIRKHFAPTLGTAKALTLSEEKERIYRETYRPVIKEIPGLTSLLVELAELGIFCGVASNSPPDNVGMVLDELGIKHFFNVIVDYTQTSKGKPDPEILLRTAEKLGVAVGRCVVVEDSISGFRAAERAQMPYIVITAGAYKNELKHASGAKAVYEDFTGIRVEHLQNCLDKEIV